MKTTELLRLRLHNQQITGSPSWQPQQVVASLVAMQAQEYAMSKWAIGLRMAGKVLDADVESAFNAGKILRTHVMRPTWHFVAPADIRWLLALTAPRVHAASAYMCRQLALDASVLRRSAAVIVRALRDEQYLTRTQLQAILAKSRIKAEGPRLGYLMMHAELEALICSGPRQGRQFTYALLESRAPGAKTLSRDDALAELSQRYFATRGPATAHDFAMWSGLTVTDARAGIESLSADFIRQSIDGKVHVFRPAASNSMRGCFAFLMPDYDEYGMSYKDRTALLPASFRKRPLLAYNRMIVADGQVWGSWQRSIAGSSVEVQTDLPKALPGTRSKAVARAIRRFQNFVRGVPEEKDPRGLR